MKRATVLIGLVNEDIGKSLLNTCVFQKPRIIFQENNFIVTNLPIERDYLKYRSTHPLMIHSYLLTMLEVALGKLIPPLQHKLERKEEIAAINFKLLREFKKIADDNNAKIYFVVYYTPEGILNPSWEELTNKNQLTELALPFVDTKELFLNELKLRNARLSDFYFLDDIHLSKAGHKIITSELKKLVIRE